MNFKRLCCHMLVFAIVACGGSGTKTDTATPSDTAPDATPALEVVQTVDAAVDVAVDTAPEQMEQDVCQPLCEDKECGDDGCGGPCGDCPSGDQWACLDGQCECTPDCMDKECGSDGCGGSCGDCEWLSYTAKCTPAGICTSGPVLPTEFYDDVLKINHMEISTGGHPGTALDVDEDPDTCAPEGNCSDGLNNQLGGLVEEAMGFFDVNAELAGALSAGDIILLFEFIDPAFDGEDFSFNMYIGETFDPVGECDWQTDKCKYLVKPESFDKYSASPKVFFDNATVTGTDLVAGGKNYIFNLGIPLTEDEVLMVTAYMARIEGAVLIEDDTIVGMTDAIIGGAIPKALLSYTIDQLPDDLDLPVSKQVIKTLFDTFLVPDVDTDGDGILDGVSLGIQFSAIEGNIIGLAPEWEE